MRIKIEATGLQPGNVAAVFVQNDLKAQCAEGSNATVVVGEGDELHITELSQADANEAAQQQSAQQEIPNSAGIEGESDPDTPNNIGEDAPEDNENPSANPD